MQPFIYFYHVAWKLERQTIDSSGKRGHKIEIENCNTCVHTWARGLSAVRGVNPFWCGGVDFFQDPYDFHMGPKREIQI